MKDLINISDLTTEDIDSLIHKAIDISRHPDYYQEACAHKKLATLFYEPSTRTRLSFEAAMLELGGSVIGFSGSTNSSASKGESVHDTAKISACYADIIAMRHNMEGAPYVAGKSTSIPVINAGDGGHSHPTQTLADLCTIYAEKNTLSNLTIGVCGDLKYGRTVHSLLEAMVRYPNNRFVLISAPELTLPDYVKKDILEASNAPYEEIFDLEDAIPKCDVLYMTRIQKERFFDPANYERLKDTYVLDETKMQKAKKDCIILHPLPRVNEISIKVDDDPRAAYFRQALNGKYMRMALILKLLNENKIYGAQKLEGEIIPGMKCTNPRCISSCEQELEPRVKKTKDGIYRCIYCEHEIK